LSKNFPSQTVISASNVYKKFRKGEFISLKSTLKGIFELLNPNNFFRRSSNSQSLVNEEGKEIKEDEFFAIKNINLKIKKGERVGIIGKNGAGKSTLVKILAGITRQSFGEIITSKRILPLISLGAGFDEQLTGKENIYLMGAIYQLSKKDIDMRYEELVEFAETKEFMNTPIKRYSKGMKARLAMSLILSFDPEVLIVDEVLAVGDVAFRKKCIEKIIELCSKGMTLIFISHSMGRVRACCNRGIIMRKGEIAFDGEVEEAIENYLSNDMGIMKEKKIDTFEKKIEILEPKNNEIIRKKIISPGFESPTQSNLIQHLDAGIFESYAGNGRKWLDISGNSNDVFLDDATLFINKNGGYFEFDGISSSIFLGAKPYLPLANNPRTIEIWALPHEPSLSQTLLSYGNLDDGKKFAITFSRDEFSLAVGGYRYGTKEISQSIKDGFNQISVVINKNKDETNEILLFLNGDRIENTYKIAGEKENSLNTIFDPNFNHLGISYKNKLYKGAISIFRVYDTALSEKNILKNYFSNKFRYNHL